MLLVSLCILCHPLFFLFFFFNDPATTEIYTLSLHDALPIYGSREPDAALAGVARRRGQRRIQLGRNRSQAAAARLRDRKSTRLNSSHVSISYAVFCLKKKKKNNKVSSQLPSYRHSQYRDD